MDTISEEEANEVRGILRQFYGSIANNWDINFEVYELLGQLVAKSKKCTTAMHGVPRPWDFSNPLKWAQKQVRQALIRYFKTPESQHYLICMKSAALSMRSDFERASSGLRFASADALFSRDLNGVTNQSAFSFRWWRRLMD